MNSERGLRFADVSIAYGDDVVLSHLDLAIAAGEFVGVVGPNGAGKSTLVKTVLGILTPLEGTVELGGQAITGLTTDRIARLGVGYVPQVRDVFETLTVRENLEMGGYTLPARLVEQRLEEIYERYPALGEMRNRYAGHLSGGERKMLAMGRVLMIRPGLLVLYHRSNAGGARTLPDGEERLLREIRRVYRGRVVAGHDLDVF